MVHILTGNTWTGGTPGGILQRQEWSTFRFLCLILTQFRWEESPEPSIIVPEEVKDRDADISLTSSGKNRDGSVFNTRSVNYYKKSAWNFLGKALYSSMQVLFLGDSIEIDARASA